MRTNIDIDDDLMAKAMTAGPYQTKKDAVEAGLKLLARQAAYREILKWEGKLRWEGDESVDWTQPDPREAAQRPEPLMISERVVEYQVQRQGQPEKTGGKRAGGRSATMPVAPASQAADNTSPSKRRAGR